MNIILTIASDRSIVESLRAALPRTDLLLFESNVEDALRRLIAMRADVVVLDDARHLGLEALKELTEAATGTPIIALVSSNKPESLAAYTLAGARDCLSKPFKCDDLVGTIGRIVTESAPPLTSSPRAIERDGSGRAIAQHQMALRWMGRAAGQAEDTPRFVQCLVDAITDIFDPARACVLLQTDGEVRVCASHGLSESVADDIRLSFAGGLMRRLEESPSLVDRDRTPLDAEVVKEMHALGGRIAAPLVSQGRACGAVVLGEKASGTDYAAEELELLTVMARCASTCLDRAQRQRDASRQQNRLDAVLANITAGVVTVAPDRTLTMMNESAERILRLKAPEVLGRSVQKLGSAFADVVLRTMNDGTPRLRQRIHDRAIDTTLGLSTTPLGPEGVVAIFSVLREEQGDSGIAYSPIWEYLSKRVAQEIKNPMVAINTFAQLLTKEYESKEFREEFAAVVQKEVGRINEVVEALYEFAGPDRLSLTPCDLNENVHTILQRFDEELAERAIRLETHFDPGETTVNLDPGQFARAVSNVIQNCIEAMPEGGTLGVRTRRDNGTCELVITDTGPGVSEQDAPFIFTPFFSTKEKGMGLGLTMASRIVEEHEGHLELMPNAETGGVFLINLPMAEPKTPDEGADRAGARGNEGVHEV